MIVAAETSFRFSPRSNTAGQIPWREWGEEAFREAKEMDRPILLAISAVWCHWCHVMDETSYSDPEVQEILATKYVPVRVDNDQRPDVNERYNQGGWPTAVILWPDGEILTGGTYIPPAAMRTFLRRAAAYYQRGGGKTAPREKPLLRPAALDPGAVAEVFTAIQASFDQDYGGFGTEPKFPMVPVLEFLLTISGEEPKGKAMLEKTLGAMAGGGLFDQIEGGFFRYSTTRDWSIPHYEKMTEDNALLARLYLRAGSGDVAVKVLNYMDENLRDPASGAFYGSQDADEEYYLLPAAQRQTPPAVDPVLYADWSFLAATAYLEAGHMLGADHWRAEGLRTLTYLWDEARAEDGGFYHFRRGGQWQVGGLLGDQLAAAEAFLAAYEATGDRPWLDRAQEITAFLRTGFKDPETKVLQDRLADGGVGLLGQANYPMEGNVRLAMLDLRLCAILEEESLREEARGILEAFVGTYQRYGLLAAGYAQAVELSQRPWLTITLPDGPEGVPLRRRALSRWDPARVLRGGSPSGALLCYGQTCYPSAASQGELAQRLEAVPLEK